MAMSMKNDFLGLVHQLTVQQSESATDDALLEAYVLHRDETAITSLVQRHSAMVWGVCRRVLGSNPDAEDAFQATFLVLVRKAGSIQDPRKFANWLYGVAQQTSIRVRSNRAKQGNRERLTLNPPEQPQEDKPVWNDMEELLDQELSRLPEKYRTVIVLCDLEEKSRSEVAGQLGCPEGTVAGRLARARALLAKRLHRRGVTTSAGALAATLTTYSKGAVPASLLQATLLMIQSRQANATITTISEGVLRSMSLKKLKVVGMILVTLLTCATGGFIVYSSAATPKAEPKPKRKAEPKPKETPMQNAFLYGRGIIDQTQPQGFGINLSHVEWWLALGNGKSQTPIKAENIGKIQVRPVDRTIVLNQDNQNLTLLGPEGEKLVFSLQNGPLATAGLSDPSFNRTQYSFTPDRKELIFANGKGTICRVNLKTKKLTMTGIKNINNSEGVHYSPDGSHIAYQRYFRKDNFSPTMFTVFTAKSDFTGEKKLFEYQDGLGAMGFGFLPDGRIGRVTNTKVIAYDIKTGKSETIAGPWKEPLQGRAFGGFSPDGSSFFFDMGGPYRLRLFVFDMKTEKVAAVGDEYNESFQSIVWVQVPTSMK